jgi:structure-specific recognition protein 1
MGAAAARTFDLKIVTKSGAEHTFTSINKEEHESVDAYLKDKKIKIKTETVPDVDMILAAGVGDDDDDDDEDMRSIDSEDDGGHRKKPSKKTGGSGGDDDDSEDDGTFKILETIVCTYSPHLVSNRGL